MLKYVSLLLSAPLNGCVKVLWRWCIGQAPVRKAETIGCSQCGKLNTESWLRGSWKGWEEQEVVPLLGWGAYGRRWWYQRSGARTRVRAALPELGPQGAGSWWRRSDCWDATGVRGRWRETPWLLPSPAVHPTCCWTALLQPVVKGVRNASASDTEQRKSKELFWAWHVWELGSLV